MKRATVLSLLLLGATQAHLHGQGACTKKCMSRSTVGVGAGMLSFFGDAGRNHDGYSPLLTRAAWNLSGSVPLLKGVEGGLFFLHGRVGIDERGVERNLSLQSRVNAFGVELRYDFEHVLKHERALTPWLSVGIAGLGYKTMADRMDAHGRVYHYWSDGTIRDRAENAEDAAGAGLMRRDNDYETDVRAQNADGFGNYPVLAAAVPLGAGVALRVVDGVELRLGATALFCLTDYVDGITEASVGNRAGDARNDRILFSHFALAYALKPKSARPPAMKWEGMPAPEMDAMVQADDDGDGVKNLSDACPGTPAGAAVDARGCPTDTDADGVADHLDQQPQSPANSVVDAQGVAISDEALAERWKLWNDSTGIAVSSSVVSSSTASDAKLRALSTGFGAEQAGYRMLLGSYSGEVPAAVARRMEALGNVDRVESPEGVDFFWGAIPERAPAEQARAELVKRGFAQAAITGSIEGRLVPAEEVEQLIGK